MQKIYFALLTIFFLTTCQKLSAQNNENGCGYNLNVSDAVCSGSSYTFPDATAINNITTQVTHTSHLFTVVNSCDSIINTTVNALPVYNNIIQSFFNICTGIDYTFPDGTVQHITAHTEYTSNLQTVGSLCDSIITTILNTTDIDIGVTVSGNVLTSHQTNCGYQWVDCDNGYAAIDGQIGQSYVAPQGNFAVIVSKGNCTDTSACEQVTTVGVDAVHTAAVYLYPNPTTGMFKVDLGTDYSEVTVIVKNLMGQYLQTRLLKNIRIFDTEIKDAAGIYFIELRCSNGLNSIYRIVKE